MSEKTVTTKIPQAEYFYDPECWETTHHRNDTECEAMIDVIPNTVKRFKLLREVGEMFCVDITTEDESEIKCFSTEAEALEAIKEAKEKSNAEA